jgi:hypothetical protein
MFLQQSGAQTYGCGLFLMMRFVILSRNAKRPGYPDHQPVQVDFENRMNVPVFRLMAWF